jgi:hypothetical protein
MKFTPDTCALLFMLMDHSRLKALQLLSPLNQITAQLFIRQCHPNLMTKGEKKPVV